MINSVGHGCEGVNCAAGPEVPESPNLLLTTRRLKVRPVIEADARATAALVSPDVAEQLMTWPSPMSEEQVLEKIHESHEGLEKREAVDFAILRRADERLLGWIGLAAKDQEARLGYWLGAEFRGAGLMTEAAHAVIGPAAEFLCVTALFAFVRMSNRPSIGVLDALGFEVSGEEELFFKFKGRSELCFRYELVLAR
jgi:RimJ/RimL family protein N-acetyltransferase